MFLYKKIKFKGKGYYLYKTKKNILALQFNYSHKIVIKSSLIFINNFSKKSWIFFGLKKLNLNLLSNYFKNFRKVNVFTLNGIRFSKQTILFKKNTNSRMGKGKGKFSRSIIKLKKYSKLITFRNVRTSLLIKLKYSLYNKARLKLELFNYNRVSCKNINIYNYYSNDLVYC